MIIGIIPVISYEKNTFYKVDIKLINFLKHCFGKKIKIKFLYYKANTKIDLIISCGGNDLTIFKKNKRNIFRDDLDQFYIKFSIKKKIPYLGICYGAQKLALFFKSKLKITNLHNANYHRIKLFRENLIMKRKSYHNYQISNLGKNLNNEGIALNDNTCEFFKHKSKKMYGIMWHPEREKKFSSIDKKIFKKLI